MTNVIIENLVQIAATLLITLIGVLGAWLSTKLAKREELKNISTATNEVIHAAQQTVLELQQTTVEGMKKAHEDGKLTGMEREMLGLTLEANPGVTLGAALTDVFDYLGVKVKKASKASWLTRLGMLAPRAEILPCVSAVVRACTSFQASSG